MKRSFTMARTFRHNTVGESKGIQYDNIPGLDDAGQAVTVAMWFKRMETQSENQQILYCDQIASDADDGGVSVIQENLSVSSSDISFRIRHSVVDAIKTIEGDTNGLNAASAIGKWFHIACTWNGVTEGGQAPRVYLNGVDVSATPSSDGQGVRLAAPGSHSWGGRESSSARGCGGVLAGCGRWNRELSAAEIKRLADGAHPLDFPAGLVICPDFATLENVAPLRTSPMPNLRENEGSVYMGPPQLREPTSRKTKYALADPLPDTRLLDVPQVWTKQPPAGTPIDWTHPLAQGLAVMAYPIGGSRFIDAVYGDVYDQGENLGAASGASVELFGPKGRELSWDTSHGQVGAAGPRDTTFEAKGRFNSNDVTVASLSRNLSTTSGNRGVFGLVGAGNGDYINAYHTSYTGITAVGIDYVDSANSFYHAIPPLVGQYMGVAGVHKNGAATTSTHRKLEWSDNPRRLLTNDATGQGTLSYNDFNTDLEAIYMGTSPYAATLAGAIWNRNLSDQELVSWFENPWQIFKRDNMHVPIEYQELTFDSDSEERLFVIPQKNTRQPR